MDKTGEEVALLIAQSGPLNGQRWAIRNKVLIGREPSCDIVLPDRQVSRQHAHLNTTRSGILLEDLDSKNGTHLNGQAIHEPVLLQDGDVIQIALTQSFVYLSSDATVPLELASLNESDLGRSLEPRDGKIDSSPTVSPSLRKLYLEKRSRRVWIRTLDSQDPKGRAHQYREVEIDPPLSVSQYKLLEVLYDHQGRVVSRQDLISSIWGKSEAMDVSEQALDALVRRLRDRLASVEASQSYIITVRGHGLRLENPTAE